MGTIYTNYIQHYKTSLIPSPYNAFFAFGAKMHGTGKKYRQESENLYPNRYIQKLNFEHTIAFFTQN